MEQVTASLAALEQSDASAEEERKRLAVRVEEQLDTASTRCAALQGDVGQLQAGQQAIEGVLKLVVDAFQRLDTHDANFEKQLQRKVPRIPTPQDALGPTLALKLKQTRLLSPFYVS